MSARGHAVVLLRGPAANGERLPPEEIVLAHESGLHPELVRRLVRLGVVEPTARDAARRLARFVRLRRDDAPEVKKREPPRREKPDQPPPPPEMNMAQNIKPGDVVGEVIPIVDTGVELEKATSLGAGGSDRDAVPLVRVDAEYPPRARQQGIEGWVELEFTITPVGTVDDVKVLAAQPQAVVDFRAGKAGAVNFLAGQVMKASRGRANPNLVRELIEQKLSS